MRGRDLLFLHITRLAFRLFAVSTHVFTEAAEKGSERSLGAAGNHNVLLTALAQKRPSVFQWPAIG